MNRAHRIPHRGSLLICVLVCLLVASAMVTATTRSALQSRRDLRMQHQMRQTEFLLDAGVLRAVRQLQDADDYDGETWRPHLALDRFDNPLLEIRISAGDQNHQDARRIEVIASLGGTDDRSQLKPSLTRRTHTFFVQH